MLPAFGGGMRLCNIVWLGTLVPALAAAEAHPRTDELGGLLFVTPPGRFLLSFSVDGSYTGTAQASATGLLGGSNRARFGSGVGVTYGIAEGLRVGVGASYLIRAFNLTPSAREDVETGFSDPSLSVSYGRFFDAFPRTFFGARLSGSPSLGAHRAASGERAGNNLSGSPSASLHADVTWVDDLAWAVGATAGWVGRGMELQGADVLTESAFPWGSVGASVSGTDADLTWSAGASLRLPTTRTFTSLGGGTQVDTHHPRVSLGVDLGTKVGPHALVGVSLGWSIANDSTVTEIQRVPAFDTQRTTRSISFWADVLP